MEKKAFNKIKHFFHNKNSQQNRDRGLFFQHDKFYLLKKLDPTSYWQKTKSFISEIINKTRMSALATSSQHCTCSFS